MDKGSGRWVCGAAAACLASACAPDAADDAQGERATKGEKGRWRAGTEGGRGGEAGVVATATDAREDAHADLTQLSTAISAGEDLGPFVRCAFACGWPEPLLSSLRAVARDRESEIEELYRAHFHDFIRAVDDIRSLLADADVLKGSLSTSHSALLSSAAPLLASLESFLAACALAGNLSSALASSRRCVRLLALAARVNDHLHAGNHSLYLALRAVDAIDLDLASGPEPLPERTVTT